MTKTTRYRRPDSLREVAERTLAGQAFDPTLREFLDEFYAYPERRADMIAAEPPLVDTLPDAYLAAVAEHLAERWRLPCPEWANGEQRFLHRPFFAGGLESLKATLLVESPTAFRRRMIFVGANVLTRPRGLAALESGAAFK
ncbi:MAG: hypothetical protein U1F68_06825 [Gammaproteobacteria bacterium]